MSSFHWLEKCVIVKKQKKTQVIWDFPDTSDQFVNPESAAWVKSTSVFCGKLQSFFFFQEKVQNQLSQHMNAFQRFQHLKVLTSMKMVVVLRIMHKTLE